MRILLVFFGFLALFGSALAERVESTGIVVEFSTIPAQAKAGEDITFRFSIFDSTTGGILTRLAPAAWIDPNTGESPKEKTERFIRGSIFGQAELDLNVYYVVSLNDDATLSVVDPRFGVGTTKLRALVRLPGKGGDWVLSRDESQLLISVPKKEQIVVVDTRQWKIIDTIDAPASRLAIQPDGHYVWASDGVSRLLAVAEGKIVAAIEVGPGNHEMAFSDNHRYAFASTRDGVAVIDIYRLEKLRSIELGMEPLSLDYSSLARAVYVGGNHVDVADQNGFLARIPLDHPVDQIRLTPDHRYALAISSNENRLYVIDTSSNTIVQDCAALGHPVGIYFSDEIAYLMDRDSPEIACVLLTQLGRGGSPISLATFPGGQEAPGLGSLANQIVQAPGHSAVLIANRDDKAIYFYKEGMAAPMGSFSNYSRKPTGIEVIDRSLSERTVPGTYESVGRLSKPGQYDVSFFLDSPRLIHRFALSVGGQGDALPEGSVKIIPTPGRQIIRLGEAASLGFQLETKGDHPTSIEVLIYRPPGVWRKKLAATYQADGSYQLEFRAPAAGIYYANVSHVSGEFTVRAPQSAIVSVLAK